MAVKRRKSLRLATSLVGLLAVAMLLSACETVRLKAEGSEKKADWGVGILF